MAVSVKPLSAAIGARITGVDLSAPLQNRHVGQDLVILPYHLQPVSAHGLHVLRPLVDEGHVEAVQMQRPCDVAADRARADDCASFALRHAEPLCPFGRRLPGFGAAALLKTRSEPTRMILTHQSAR